MEWIKRISWAVYKLTYTEKQYEMEFDYDYVSVDRIPNNHLFLKHDVSV
jgi:hypothetical protein